MNEIAALSHLLERGELTRADLRELTGLSKPTISEAVRRLTEAGLVVVVGHVSAGPGPNAEVYAANPQAAYVIAVSVRDTFMGHSPSLAAALCGGGPGPGPARSATYRSTASTASVAPICRT